MAEMQDDKDQKIEKEIQDANALEEQLTAEQQPQVIQPEASPVEKLQQLNAQYQQLKQPKQQAIDQSDMDKAFAERDRRQMVGNLLKSFQQLTQAGVNVADPNYKVDSSVADNILKTSDNPVEDYKLKVSEKKAQDKEKRDQEHHDAVMSEYFNKLQMSNLDLTNAQKVNDPESDESKMAQEFLLKMDPSLNKDMVNRQSGATLFRIAPMLQKLVAAKIRSDASNTSIQKIEEDGVNKTVIVDKRTGERLGTIGQTGYATGAYKDPVTGQMVQYSKSNMKQLPQNISNPSPQVMQNRSQKSEEKADINSNKDEQKIQETDYQYPDIQKVAPKIANDFDKIQNNFIKDLKDNREVATSVTNLKSKLSAGQAWGEGIDSGLLGGIQTQAARMAGQKGVLTDQDLNKFAGAGGVAATMSRLLNNPLGKMSDQDVKFFNRFSELMGHSLEKDIENKSQIYVQQAKQRLQTIMPDITDKNVSKMLGVSKIAPIVQDKAQSDKVKIKLPDGRIGSIPRQNLEKAKANGAVEVE